MTEESFVYDPWNFKGILIKKLLIDFKASHRKRRREDYIMDFFVNDIHSDWKVSLLELSAKDCIAACNIVNDTGATQAWSVSFFFINLVLGIAVGILFMSNAGPGKIYLD